MAHTTVLKIDYDVLSDVRDAAMAKIAGNERWENAIEAGYDFLVSADVVLYEQETHALLVPSSKGNGQVYRANGTCGCKAFEKRQPCYHRAASRLVLRMKEITGS